MLYFEINQLFRKSQYPYISDYFVQKLGVMKKEPRIELLTLGDELLLGIRDNSLLMYLGAELERHGLVLERNTVVRDKTEEILESFKSSWERSDIVITTGGLGAMRINNTREAVASALGIGLEFDPTVEAAIQLDFDSIGRNMGKRYIRQCYKLEGSELLTNNFGTAPGIWLEKDGKIVVMLPAMPSELKPMFKNEVIPRLQDKNLLKPGNAYYQLRTIGISEEKIEELLAPIYDKNPGIGINFCLSEGIIEVRLSSDAVGYSWQQLKKIGQEARELLGDDCFAYGHDTLHQQIFDQLRAMEKKLAVAESCTGGKLADAFTNIPGASKVFAGGVICYNNEAKIHMLGVPESIIDQHGAVSAEAAVAMATAVAEKFSSNYGLSVTGFAGPGGGTADNPLGTIYIGYHSPSGVWAHKVMYPGQREAVKVKAVNAAFDWMRRKLSHDQVQDYMADLDLEN